MIKSSKEIEMLGEKGSSECCREKGEKMQGPSDGAQLEELKEGQCGYSSDQGE